MILTISILANIIPMERKLINNEKTKKIRRND